MTVSEPLVILANAVGERLRCRGLRLATAESCTGGWVAKTLTDIVGSSTWFECAFVTYSNAAKRAMLGVGADTLDRHGAVSAETVTEMVDGALRRADAEVALAVSGIAGPGGGTPNKPVGTVWFAWGGPHGTRTCRRHFTGPREAVRRQAAEAALEGLMRYLD